MKDWASMLRVDYPCEKFNIGLVGLHASGADSPKTGPTGLSAQAPPGAAAGVRSSKIGAYVVPPQAEVGLGATNTLSFPHKYSVRPIYFPAHFHILERNAQVSLHRLCR